MNQTVTEYRALRAGPETTLQRQVEHNLPDLFQHSDRLVWTASSVPIGAGRPDIVVATYNPEVVVLSDVDVEANSVLAYLRAVGRARSETISARLGRNLKRIEKSLSLLADANVIIVDRGAYSLSAGWREVLPEVITIEVKVADWRRAVSQAARNRVFAHRSFVALPSEVADRVANAPPWTELGIGLIAIDVEGDVRVVRRPRRHLPRAWTYYYSLAFMAAEDLSGGTYDVRGAAGSGKGAVPRV